MEKILQSKNFVKFLCKKEIHSKQEKILKFKNFYISKTNKDPIIIL